MNPMDRILVLGGGVGGTLTANLLARKLRRQLKAGTATITVVDTTGEHVYQPGFMYIAMGGERAENLSRPERGLLDKRVNLVVGTVVGIDEETRLVELADGNALRWDHLVLATGSRIVPESIEHFTSEAYHFYSAEAAADLRAALDAFTGGRIVIGIAGMPYKCPPAPLEVAFLIESELRERGLRDKTRSTSARRSGERSPSRASRRWPPRSWPRRGSSCTPSSTSSRSTQSARSSSASRARSCPTTS
jgi:Uncharacterized NAD(FAD)-dependent dehydrogenases